MAKMREQLRSSRKLLILFLAMVALPAATLVVLGLRLLEQDRALARQRQTELLELACDRSVRVLDQDLQALMKRLAEPSWTPAEVPPGSVHVLFGAGRTVAIPPGRLPYYPAAPEMKEPPAAPFHELESLEFKGGSLDAALEMSRRLASSPDEALRAGALLRQARILRKAGRRAEALRSYDMLSGISTVAIAGAPADLVARRARCALLEEQGRPADLAREASAIAADLRSGKWQLDRTTYFHVAGRLGTWLGEEIRPSDEEAALASAVEWLHENRSSGTPEGEVGSSGMRLVSLGAQPVTVIWTAGPDRLAAFVAGPRYAEQCWAALAHQAAGPARVYLTGPGGRAVFGDAPGPDSRRIQRAAADTGLPWTVSVTGSTSGGELGEISTRRNTLLAGLAAILTFIAAGGYFIWRAVSRELAVARLQSDFVSAVSHEFRTPLTTLRQYNELLADDENMPAEKRRGYNQAQTRATDRLHRLVESLLDFGRMEAGKRPYRFEPLDAAALAADVVAEFRNEAEASGREILCGAAPGEFRVNADSEALARALWNLLDNAAKYSGDGDKIEVAVDRKGNLISIAVRDRGIGIPPSEQGRIFQKFARGAAAKTLGVRGTGIGLAMVRHILEAHGGRVTLESVPGSGSTFTILLPAKG